MSLYWEDNEFWLLILIMFTPNSADPIIIEFFVRDPWFFAQVNIS